MSDDADLPSRSQIGAAFIIHELLLAEISPILIHRFGECVGTERGSGQMEIRNEIVMGVPLDHILEDKAGSLISPFTSSHNFIHQILSEHIIRINPGDVHIGGVDFMDVFLPAIVINGMKLFMCGDFTMKVLEGLAQEQEDLEFLKLLIQQAGQGVCVEQPDSTFDPMWCSDLLHEGLFADPQELFNIKPDMDDECDVFHVLFLHKDGVMNFWILVVSAGISRPRNEHTASNSSSQFLKYEWKYVLKY